MATIDIGKIKQVWRGTYASGTAYTPDDVVQYTDSGLVSSYICIANTTGNAPSSSGTAHGSWNYLAKGGAAGADGTDVGAALSNNQIAYKNNSGSIAGLSIGSAGQALKVNSGANGYEFGAVAGGKILQVVQSAKTDTASWSAHATTRVATGLSASITPSATSSKILIQYMINIGYEHDNSQYYLHLFRGSTEINNGDASSARKQAHNGWGGSFQANLEEYMSNTQSGMFLDSPSTTSATTYSIKHTDATSTGTYYINRSHRDNNGNGYDPRFVSNMVLMEVGA